MDKKKIIWTVVAVALVGIVASNFLHECDNLKIYCRILHSDGFAFTAGLVISGVYCVYYIK